MLYLSLWPNVSGTVQLQGNQSHLELLLQHTFARVVRQSGREIQPGCILVIRGYRAECLQKDSACQARTDTRLIAANPCVSALHAPQDCALSCDARKLPARCQCMHFKPSCQATADSPPCGYGAQVFGPTSQAVKKKARKKRNS